LSIVAEGITKKYGEQLALKQVSFKVNAGEVVGFIGPNGAGKSTTMKIITGTVRPDQGRVLIKDIPVFEQLKETRRTIGYLPEHNPLYLDMYIREYLAYVAGLYGLKGESRKRKVEEVIERTGLGPEVGKLLGNLSKGYRQRVGLAQALVHDPEILILDEPTTGLDPNQLAEIRKLVSEIGKEKTILLSTHILQEVEAICHRVIIIREGEIVADNPSATLRERPSGTFLTLKVELQEEASPEIWKIIPGVQGVKALNTHTCLLELSSGEDLRGEVFKFAVDQGLTILSLSSEERSLEQVFRDLTQA